MSRNIDDDGEEDQHDDDGGSSSEHDDRHKPEDKSETIGEDGAEGGKRKRKRKRKKNTTDSVDQARKKNDGPVPKTVVDGTARDMVELTVYVEGIPFDATPEQVKEFFVSKGGIEDIKELRLPTWQDSGRLRGYGHVVLDSETSYANALKLSGELLGKRYLTIQPANTPKNNMAPVTARCAWAQGPRSLRA